MISLVNVMQCTATSCTVIRRYVLLCTIIHRYDLLGTVIHRYVLLLVGVNTVDILNMVCKVKTLYPQMFSTFLTVCHRPDPSATHNLSLSQQLTHWSDLTLHVDQLSTGLSKDVHGQVRG